jgi:putative FmdB family regulatory protein
MPIYVYRCRACGEEFEKLVLSVSRAASIECPACQSEDLEQRPALFGFTGTSGSTASANCSTPTGGG